MEKASFKDMRSCGLVPRDCTFAGHSLSKYSTLAALAEIMPIKSLVNLRTLNTLISITNFYKQQKINIKEMRAYLEEAKGALRDIIKGCAEATVKKPTPLELQRGFATIPLYSINMPFYSTFLRSGAGRNIDPTKLVSKYIPNVRAKPFALTKEYFKDVYKLTNSPKIASVLAN
ncbi:Fatty acid synthase subunit beta 6 [Colletotrichum chlorophyti]|uniref:Fatty acid synthase subunit beta 6 n=1 Tax=Colletotrichum chlorophyti TaxID=708187 RepID=A0A1Q8S2R6_9PEZI|nr:Fatty acid synthase subunit beta 6 [Colletotrichum chlorophyti]